MRVETKETTSCESEKGTFFCTRSDELIHHLGSYQISGFILTICSYDLVIAT
jgi:hypothetical protein